jgi:hypothetical protein
LAYSEKSTYDDGESCTLDSECTSGNCADGVCCDTSCAGGCTDCNLSGTEGVCTTAPDTNWGAGLYQCIASDAKCVSGVCRDCSDTGGKMYGSNCWRQGAASASCNTTCSSYGGCSYTGWDDNSSCSVSQLFVGTCGGGCLGYNSQAGMPAHVWSSMSSYWRCGYSKDGATTCAGSIGGYRRICVCGY